MLPEMGALWLARERFYRRRLRGRMRLPGGAPVEGTVDCVAHVLSAELPVHEEYLEQHRGWIELTGAGASDEVRDARRADEKYVAAMVRQGVEMLGVPLAERLRSLLVLSPDASGSPR